MARSRKRPSTPSKVDWGALTDRVLRPARPRLDDVLALLLGPERRAGRSMRDALAARWDDEPTGPAAAWEALAAEGLIPLTALDDARRGFTTSERCTTCVTRPLVDSSEWCEACGSSRLRAGPRPATAHDAAVFASDWENVLAVEACARHYASLIEHPRAERVVFRVLDAGEARALHDRWPALRASWTEPLASALAAVDAAGYMIDKARSGGLLVIAPPLEW